MDSADIPFIVHRMALLFIGIATVSVTGLGAIALALITTGAIQFGFGAIRVGFAG